MTDWRDYTDDASQHKVLWRDPTLPYESEPFVFDAENVLCIIAFVAAVVGLCVALWHTFSGCCQ